MDSIREMRSSVNMSQEEFSQFVGVSVSTIRNWEQGRSSPPKYVMPMLKTLVDMRCNKESGVIREIYIPDGLIGDDAVKQVFLRSIVHTLGILGKVMKMYYERNEYTDLDMLKTRFEQVYVSHDIVMPIIEGMFDRRLRGIGEICSVIFGENSDEMFIINDFLRLHGSMDDWTFDTSDDNERVRNILFGVIPSYKLVKPSDDETHSDIRPDIDALFLLNRLNELSMRSVKPFISLKEFRQTDGDITKYVVYDSKKRMVSLCRKEEHGDLDIMYCDSDLGNISITVDTDSEGDYIRVASDTFEIRVRNGNWYFYLFRYATLDY